MQRGIRRKRRVCKSASTTDRPADRCIHLGRSPAAALLRAPSLLFSQNNGTSPPPCSRLQKVWLCAGGKGGRGSDACKNSLLFVSVYVRERFKSAHLFHAIILCGKLLCSDAFIGASSKNNFPRAEMGKGDSQIILPSQEEDGGKGGNFPGDPRRRRTSPKANEQRFFSPFLKRPL